MLISRKQSHRIDVLLPLLAYRNYQRSSFYHCKRIGIIEDAVILIGNEGTQLGKKRSIKLSQEKMVFWVFGYGSLVWNPGFDYDEKIVGFIKDYRRVFDLACIDHRGTPDHPARTCTLEHLEDAICWGVAYCVRGDSEKEQVAMQYLEHRECEYDKKSFVNFFKEDDPVHPALTEVIIFTSTPDKVSNKYYLGPAPLEDMARQIATACGPNGYNREYLFKLETALLDIGHQDDKVTELATEVRRILQVHDTSTCREMLSSPTKSLNLLATAAFDLRPLTQAVGADL